MKFVASVLVVFITGCSSVPRISEQIIQTSIEKGVETVIDTYNDNNEDKTVNTITMETPVSIQSISGTPKVIKIATQIAKSATKVVDTATTSVVKSTTVSDDGKVTVITEEHHDSIIDRITKFLGAITALAGLIAIKLSNRTKHKSE